MILEKVLSGQRLLFEDGCSLLRLKESAEIEAVCHLADHVRQKKVGDTVSLPITLYLYPTNLCTLKCPLCSFYAIPNSQNAWENSHEALLEKISIYLAHNITETHIVGGLWPTYDLNYYTTLFEKIKRLAPSLHIKALTAVEIDYLSHLAGLSHKETLLRLKAAGLDSLPGGGAEILVDAIRKKIAPKKISSDCFLSIHKTAHQCGLKSNVTMLFDHIESEEDIIHHLLRVRELQDETGGFCSFIPLRFGRENNALGKLSTLKPKNLALIYAVSRLMLDNFDHIKVLWHYLGFETGLEMMKAGASEFSTINLEEKVIAMAGGEKREVNMALIENELKKLGREPILCSSEVIAKLALPGKVDDFSGRFNSKKSITKTHSLVDETYTRSIGEETRVETGPKRMLAGVNPRDRGLTERSSIRDLALAKRGAPEERSDWRRTLTGKWSSVITSIGMPCYQNTLPYRLGLKDEREVALITGVPTRINEQYLAGSLDCALISSIEAKEGPFLPFGIAAENAVTSVNLYVKEGTSLENGVVGVTSESATSRELLRVLAHHFWKIEITLETMQNKPYDAFLLIGDAALNNQQIPGYQAIDLATAWHKATSLPFVFAIFALTDKANETNLHHLIDQALTRGEPQLPNEPYFELLRYRLGKREFEAFSLFHKLSACLKNSSTRSPKNTNAVTL